MYDIYWAGLPSLETGRSCHIAFYLENKLNVFGGRVGTGFKWSKTSEILNKSKENWLEGPELPFDFSDLASETNRDNTFALIIGWHHEERRYVINVFEKATSFTEIAKLDFNYVNKITALLI